MSKIIRVEDIEGGMVIGKPIVNSYGQTLIASGTELSEKHINILRTWNIQTVSINTDDDTFEQIDIEIMNLARRKLLNRLKWEPRNKNEEDLIQLGTIAYAKLLMNRKT